jgi:hypothetical protein
MTRIPSSHPVRQAANHSWCATDMSARRRESGPPNTLNHKSKNRCASRQSPESLCLAHIPFVSTAMKLSPALEALLNAAQCCPGPVPAPSHIQDVFSNIEQEASARKLNRWLWLAVSTATVMTMSSPEAMADLFRYTTTSSPLRERVAVAEFMREIGLRCLGINGVWSTTI